MFSVQCLVFSVEGLGCTKYARASPSSTRSVQGYLAVRNRPHLGPYSSICLGPYGVPSGGGVRVYQIRSGVPQINAISQPAAVKMNTPATKPPRYRINFHRVSESTLEDQYFTEMCSGSETGSYLRLIDFVYHSTLCLGVIKRKKKKNATRGGGVRPVEANL